MGFMFMVGECFGCKRLFTFHPNKVPSIRVNENGYPDPAGKREPVCRNCVEAANRIRAKTGLPLIPILDEAYGAEEVL